MAPIPFNSSSRRQNPFARNSYSPSPAPQSPPATGTTRPKSVQFTSPPRYDKPPSHTRNSSFSPLNSAPNGVSLVRRRSNSAKNSSQSSNTFAPGFIKSEELQRGADQIRGLEGDNDFSGKRYVWMKDSERAFIKGLVLDDRADGTLLVQCDDGDVSAGRTRLGSIQC